MKRHIEELLDEALEDSVASIRTEEQRESRYRLNMSMKLIVPLNRAWATSWDRLTAS